MTKCEHNRIKSTCKDCKGGSICEHNSIKSSCKDCKGGSICEHNRIKSTCKECEGSIFCIHNKRKSRCEDCNGSELCEHNRFKNQCKECNGSSICDHDKRRANCIICSPNSKAFCKSCRLFRVNKNTNYLCTYCNPDKPTHIKVKELELKLFLEENQYKFEYNKYCNYLDQKYFPDFLIDFNTFYLIIECDEYAHRDRDKKCEKIRENNIILALNKNCVFIRYNPDNKRNRKKIKRQDKQKILKSNIDYYTNKESSDNEIIYLFY